MSFSDNLKRLMQEKKVTNYRVAKELEMSPASVGYWLNGERTPDTKNVLKLSEYFGVTVEQLMK